MLDVEFDTDGDVAHLRTAATDPIVADIYSRERSTT